MYTLLSNSTDETKKIAYTFAKYLKKCDVIVLSRRFRFSGKQNLLKDF